MVETPNDEIVGAAVLQMVPYLGPFKIHPDWRGRVNYLRIKQDIDGQFGKVGGSPLIIQGYIALTDDDQLIAMAETAKMKRLACVTFLNEIEEENGLPR